MKHRDFSGLLKIAYMEPPRQTVGDFMNWWNGDIHADTNVRRNAFDRINAAGIDVKQPASRLPYIIGGGLTGGALSSYLGMSGTGRTLSVVGGALVGNHIYNKGNQDIRDYRFGNGLSFRGF